jgi:hypothetical protein
MKELKTVKDVLKDVLRFMEKLQEGTAYLFLHSSGKVYLKIIIHNESCYVILINYFCSLRRRIVRWTDHIFFKVEVVGCGQSHLDFDNSSFEFSPKQPYSLRFKKGKPYRGLEVKAGNYYDINLIDLN